MVRISRAGGVPRLGRPRCLSVTTLVSPITKEPTPYLDGPSNPSPVLVAVHSLSHRRAPLPDWRLRFVVPIVPGNRGEVANWEARRLVSHSSRPGPWKALHGTPLGLGTGMAALKLKRERDTKSKDVPLQRRHRAAEGPLERWESPVPRPSVERLAGRFPTKAWSPENGETQANPNAGYRRTTTMPGRRRG